jgi:hypothetical protein
MAVGLVPAHRADDLFSGPDASDSSVRGAAKSMFIQRDRPSRLADRTAPADLDERLRLARAAFALVDITIAAVTALAVGLRDIFLPCSWR